MKERFQRAQALKTESNSGQLGNFLSGSDTKEPACNAGDAGDLGLIPGLRRSPGEGETAGHLPRSYSMQRQS